jgi:hypothetical protein
VTTLEVKRRRLHPGQARVKASPARFRSCMFGRRWGKNVLGVDEAMTSALAGKTVGWFEPTYKYLLESWNELVSRLRVVATHVSDQHKRLELITGGVIEAWTCDTPDPARGRAYDLVIINEAGIIRELLEIWQQAIRPTLTDRQGRALFMGTPKGRSHDFSLIHTKAETTPSWEAFRGPTADNPYIPGLEEELAQAKAELPPQVFAQEYEGIPSDDGGNPFGLDAIRACVGEPPVELEAVAFGWDFARAQDWTVGVALDKDYHVVAFERWQLVPWGETRSRVLKVTGATPAWGDSTAMGGDVVVEDLQRAGCPMIGVPFSQKMKQLLMERLAVCLQQRKLRFPDGPIRAELESFGYEYTKFGVRYTAPAGLHDDCVMALALAVYGRDQFGAMVDAGEPALYDENRHPGFDVGGQRRKRPWEQGWQPDVVSPEYVPSETSERLGWT